MLLAFGLVACRSKKTIIIENHPFSITLRTLTLDTPIRRTLYHNGFYLSQLDNNNYAVWDTNFNRHPEIEKLLANTGTKYFYKSNDTTILSTETMDFYLIDDFKLKVLNANRHYREPVFYGELFLEDSLYQVYGCCDGEFGGSLFFYNKKNQKLYFHNAGCVNQVVFFHNSYFVFDNLYNAGYTRIMTPEKLLELKYKNRLYTCNWWTQVDSLNDYDKNNDLRIDGVVKYNSRWNESSLHSFTYHDTLFTIISTDSSTYLAMHQGDSLKTIQTILNKKLWFHHSEFYEEAGRRIISFSASSIQSTSQPNIETYITNSGFVIITGQKIDIVEYSTEKTYVRH